MYTFKEIFYTIQGEGLHAGQPAVFSRFTGCNLWSGREQDRSKAICQFCDTDFLGTDGENGGKYTAEDYVKLVRSLWPDETKAWVVFTGGEPLLQLDETLIKKCHENNLHVAVETNGTIAAPKGIDWLCVSPKAGSEVIQKQGDELKLVYPQSGLDPGQFLNWDFRFFSLQPMDNPLRKVPFGEHEDNVNHTNAAVEYCRKNPKWRLSLQLHKTLGIP